MAAGLAAAIRQELPDIEVETIAGGKGDFIVKSDGQLLWDKVRREGDFPEHADIIQKLSG